jgi:N-acetylmuramic acid 6-phosphate etherase
MKKTTAEPAAKTTAKPKSKAAAQNAAFVKITEQASLYDHLEKKSVSSILADINAEDKKVALAIEKVLPQIEKLVTQILPRMQHGGRIFYIGAGTSGRLGVLDASEIPPTFGMPNTLVVGLIAGGDRALRNPVEKAEDDMAAGWNDLLAHNINKKDTLIGIAASGATPYVVGALREARKHGILTASISSNPASPIAQEADIAIEMIVGPEYVTGSSRMKSGTGQKMILNMITTATMIKLGRVKGNRMVNMQLTNTKLIDRGTRMVMDDLKLDYDQAQRLLLLHGSVRQAIESYGKGEGSRS